MPQLGFARGETGEHGIAELGNHVASERVHLLHQAVHGGMGVGVAEAQDPELRLPLGQLLERRRQLRRALHRADHGELIHRDAAVARVVQNVLNRLAVVRQRPHGDLQIDITREGGVSRGAATVGALRRTL